MAVTGEQRAPNWAAVGILVGSGALLASRVASYFPFIADDAFISLRYAQRLLDGHGLTWTDGERVEGYTDLAWVLLTALLGLFHVDLMLASRVLGCVGAAACVVVPAFSLHRPFRLDAVRAATGSLMIAVSAPVAVWAIGGLEQCLSAGALISACWLLMRRPVTRGEQVWFASLLVLLVLLRADGALLVAAMFGAHTLREVLERRSLALIASSKMLAAPVLAFFAQLTFRKLYYDAWVPNTALVKAGASFIRLVIGANHVWEWFLFAWPLLVLVICACAVLVRSRDRSWLIPLGVSLFWFAYVAMMGGDIFPGWRQLLPGIAPLSLVLAAAAEAWWRDTSLRLERALVAVLTLAMLAVYGRAQELDPKNRHARTERWEFEGLAFGEFLKAAWGERSPLLAVDAAGAVPYAAQMRSLDMLGLNDRYIATHQPPGVISLAHELGDGAYVWSRRPDIVNLCGTAGAERPCFRGGRQLFALPEFADMYQRVRVHVLSPQNFFATLWLRREDSVVGVTRDERRIVVPGWLLTEISGTAELHDGKLKTPVSIFNVAHLERLRVPAGRWKVSSKVDVTLGITCNGENAVRELPGSLVVELQQETRIGLLVGGRDTTQVYVDEVLLEHTDDEVTARCEPKSRLRLTAFSNVVPDGAFHWQPEGALLRRDESVQISLTPPHRGQFEASLDANDAYSVRALRGDVVVKTFTLEKVNAAGLLRRQFEIPEDADVLEFTPRGDDPLSGLGHLVEVQRSFTDSEKSERADGSTKR